MILIKRSFVWLYILGFCCLSLVTAANKKAPRFQFYNKYFKPVYVCFREKKQLSIPVQHGPIQPNEALTIYNVSFNITPIMSIHDRQYGLQSIAAYEIQENLPVGTKVYVTFGTRGGEYPYYTLYPQTGLPKGRWTRHGNHSLKNNISAGAITELQPGPPSVRPNFQLVNEIQSNGLFAAKEAKEPLDLWMSISSIKEDAVTTFRTKKTRWKIKPKKRFHLDAGEIIETIIDPNINLFIVFFNRRDNKFEQLGGYSINKENLGKVKTVYLTLGRRRGRGPVTLYPQTGQKGKTVHGGYSIKNNVKKITSFMPLVIYRGTVELE